MRGLRLSAGAGGEHFPGHPPRPRAGLVDPVL